MNRSWICWLLILTVFACADSENSPLPDQPTLQGGWRYATFTASGCNDSADDRNEKCVTTPAECGVLVVDGNHWSWKQTNSDGSQFSESGTYTLTGNYIIIEGANIPGTKMYSLNGSVISYTKTALTFTNSSQTTGCDYVTRFSRHSNPVVPSN